MRQENAIMLTPELMGRLLGLDEDHNVLRFFQTSSDLLANRMSVVVSGPDCNKVFEGTPVPYEDHLKFRKERG